MDVLTFGETMVLFNPQSNGPLRYVSSFNKSIAGAESNVAIALSRLGHEAAWFSKLGEDEFGRYIRNAIRSEGVDTSRTKFTNEKSSAILFKERFGGENPNVYYYRQNSAATTLTVEELDLEYIKQAEIIHITGITPALSDGLKKVVFEVLRIARENNIRISFDPNIRLKLWDIEEAKPILLDIARSSDIVLPGISEGEMLLGTRDEKQIANKFLDLGCKLVAVKLGEKGCYVANSSGGTYVGGYEIKNPVDTVGAGDGFAAGFLSGILRNLSLEECGQLGNGVGAMATLVQGDMEGYPYFEQLLTFMGKRKSVDR